MEMLLLELRIVNNPASVSDGYHVPAGAMVNIAVLWIHRDRNIYGEDYLEFKPERFEKENAAGRHPFAYIPFSAGSRNCIGKWDGAVYV